MLKASTSIPTVHHPIQSTQNGEHFSNPTVSLFLLLSSGKDVDEYIVWKTTYVKEKSKLKWYPLSISALLSSAIHII